MKNSTKRKNIVVVGNGMVGYKFCERMVEQGHLQNFKISVFGEELYPAYDRVQLSSFFNGLTVEDLQLSASSWYQEVGIDLYLNELVVAVDTKTRTVTSQNGRTLGYDELILATGSSAFVPPIPGIERDGVFVYRTIEDLERIEQYSKKSKSAAVIGGGLLGLEAAKATLDLGLSTHVVEFAPKLMPRQLDDKGSAVLVSKIESLGIEVHTDKQTKCIQGNGAVTGLDFMDGSKIAVDMVVVSAGIRPRDELAKAVGLAVGSRGGIVVDQNMQTSKSGIYAIGESAAFEDKIYGLVKPGFDMAQAAIDHIIGAPSGFKGADMSTKLKLLGVDVASFGDALGETNGTQSIVYENGKDGVYKRINISADGKYLVGGILVGDAQDYNMLIQRMQSKIILPNSPESLIIPNAASETSGLGVMDLPEEALICSCENISKGAITSLIKKGDAQNIEDIKFCTKAGTGCGGCMPMLSDLYHETLKSLGKEVKKNICEHFDYTRQELLHLSKVNNIKTYAELLQKHGKGHGCETCRPLVGSIMASLWNDVILKQAHVQDTNDRFLANIQRGGTYSVVPRIPGGEITPEKLIVIGKVAKKYSLYTKITGGQRIDLFGAKLNELPLIWEELIEAGFESGHAYGKSLRTVKSCVGTTWCRYGVQDAVGFAIEIENRYKGLRSPHKLKSAVSGCTRECAEAQSKDFGLIATEKGWNIFVCGNGGTKPQHAVLLASDVDSATCLQYLDRFLMFYIKTAEPLQRTAPWLNKLDGGLEYLKSVVIDDALGIAAELETQMNYQVATYHCEWKDAVENEDRRKMFRHFANSDDDDNTLEFIDVRGQKIPAPW